tara:strand:+ start:493 stop:858 length:366 start_codon:yes stop_codon:yes gene_type:complete
MIKEIMTVAGQKYYKKFYEHCLRHNLWTGFARERVESNRDDTKEHVKKFLTQLITNNSNYTKRTLMKYARENYKGPCAYKDVGKVVSRIIDEELGSKYGALEKTKTNKLRVRSKYEQPITI